ncbi:TolC family protein [Paremcibacter congregatus]|uniref:RND transporter n=1 Tax=Paremcibacter congregatus TaxID=2043170 RepID=A0A2G4YNI1_9PROT|nr:TolC family protein [Paremcibacter congregatus]PHZ83867.1 hypothetical protein CRD36_16085 [Paremcibacter congregatus]QDE27572.1 TolC family protein [Paremcibacter congregatus]
MIKRQVKIGPIIFISIFVLTGCAGSVGENKPWVMPSRISEGNEVYPVQHVDGYIEDGLTALTVTSEIGQLTKIALKNNTAIKVAEARYSEAIANMKSIDAGIMPKVDIGVKTTRTRAGNENSGVAASTSQSSSGSVDLRIPIDLFGKIKVRRRAAAYEVEQTREELENTRIEVMRDVVVAVVDAAEQSQLQSLNKAQLETSRTSYKLTAYRYTKGQANIVDVLQQRDLVASLEQETPRLVAERQGALDRLSLLMGALPGNVATNGFQKLPVLPEIEVVVTPIGLLGSRPNMRALKAGVDAADSQLSSAIKDRLPSFEFSSSAIATLKSGDISSIISSTLSAAFTFFDGGVKRAAIKARRASRERAGTIYIEAWLNAVVEVNGLLAEEKRRITEYALAKARLENARNLHAAAERRYRFGASDYLLVLTAMRTIQQQERSLLTLQSSLLRAQIKLHTAMGGQIIAESS